ncbi:MAG: hypothetical protein IJA55_08005 [Clostridia bacterium]|nr:hypothetical protein [Clostridia bacterium]
MYIEKKRAELADICYMTIEKECSKPTEEINTALIDACIDLANKLLDIKPLSEEELLRAKKKIEAMALHRRKKNLKIRIIAAILAIIVVLVTTACAFSDWLVGIFGINTLYTVQSGESVTVEQHKLEAPSDVLNFDSIDDLDEYIEEPIYLPIGLPEEFVLSSITMYKEETSQIEIIWTKESHRIRYKITFDPSYFNKSRFDLLEYEYYSQDGYPFDCVQITSYWQASSWINDNEYVISADNTDLIEEIINYVVVTQ